jgi:hypothetical protein
VQDELWESDALAELRASCYTAPTSERAGQAGEQVEGGGRHA